MDSIQIILAVMIFVLLIVLLVVYKRRKAQEAERERKQLIRNYGQTDPVPTDGYLLDYTTKRRTISGDDYQPAIYHPAYIQTLQPARRWYDEPVQPIILVESTPQQNIVIENNMITFSEPEADSAPAFTGFSGGDSAGGGASSNWDPTPAASESSYSAPDNSYSGNSSYSDSSSSYDSGGDN